MAQLILSEPSSLPDTAQRMRVDGKFFARDGRRVHVQGVTYGPFAPNPDGQPFPTPDRVGDDFIKMRAIGINAIRTYYLPPEWFLDLADEHKMSVFIDVPWSKHLCFLDNRQTPHDARRLVRQMAESGREHSCILAYSIGNEIPFDIVRWHGAKRVEGFLAELMDVAKQADPEGLVTYANYPSTEYLDLSFFDFITFNVYLHDREPFSRYLLRLQNLAGDKPLVLGEIGMDTIRHGEGAQAEFLTGHLREATLFGLAGAFIFSWTDDWHTGGYPIEDWAFGITRRDRSPKASYPALRQVFGRSPAELLTETPRVSVVVCSYNGGSTLEQCLCSLRALDYPDYEIILVDDGSTDNTRAIVARFPTVRVIHQPNRGLSFARNVGLQAATGAIIAYTDSDCFVDSNWLTHLVYQLQHTGAAGVGGPNLSPEDGWMAACVAASPGQPTHVLESNEVAEHIPGCNMAFRREALEATNGFDPVFRKAGDDVDLCWRLQQAGFWITFAPGAFVWHHRRQNPRAYFRQQVGYGEAEALLQFKHPDKFNIRGNSKWRGVVYGACLQGLRLAKPVIYRGTFGTGLFQCLYQPGPASWASLPSTLEWHAGAAVFGLTSIFWSTGWMVTAFMLVLSLAVAVLQAVQARLAPQHGGLKARLLIAALCYAQPLVRSWKHYRTRLFFYRVPEDLTRARAHPKRLPLSGVHTAEYWTAEWRDRTELLDQAVAYLTERRWAKTINPGWSDWDLEIYCHPWTAVQIRTVQENHGSGKRLIRVQYRLRLTEVAEATAGVGVIIIAVAIGFHVASAAIGYLILVALMLGAWWRGTDLAAKAVEAFDLLASGLRLVRCEPLTESEDKTWRACERGGDADGK